MLGDLGLNILWCNVALRAVSPQSGLSPLHLAAQEDRVNVAQVLVKHGAAVDPQTRVRPQEELLFIFTVELKETIQEVEDATANPAGLFSNLDYFLVV